jgi:hypothetical protein
MAGRTASNTVTRYAGIQVQTSSLGVNIPVMWGTGKVGCNLVDYLDFTSKAQKAAASKGGSTTTGYSYTATIILAICEGPIDNITTVYVDGKVYANGSTFSTVANTGSKTATAQANLNFNTGAIGQAVWSYLTSNHPTHAIGYSGLAIAYQKNYALDSSASTPNHSFEVVRTASYGVSGTPDADPSLVVADFFQNARYGVPSWPASGLLGNLTQYQDYCLAAGLLVSPVIDSQRSASDFLTELLMATNSTCVWSEGVLKFIPYGDTALTGNGKTYTPVNTAVYALVDDDYLIGDGKGGDAGDDPLKVDIEDQSDAYNAVQFEYLDRTNQYNMAIAFASDAANVAQYGERRKDPDTVHCIGTPAVAALSAQLWLQRTLYVRAQYKFTLDWSFALLEPGDIVELTDTGLGLSAYPVRIIQIDDDEDACREITAEDFLGGVAHAPLYAMQTGGAPARNTSIDPGGVEANLLLHSDDPTQSSWFDVGITIGAAAGNDQYGLATAANIIPSATSGVHGLAQAFNAFAGINYTYSVCLKQGAHRYTQIQISDNVANAIFATIDLQTGAVLAQGAYGPNAVLVGATVNTTLVSGIWQAVLTGANTAGGTLYAYTLSLDASQNVSWTGDGSNAFQVSQPMICQGVAPWPVYAATTTEHAQPLLFNPPAVLNDGGSQVFAAVAGGPNWGGAYVWLSLDGSNYSEVGVITSPARYGVLTANFPSAADPDTTDTLSVDLGWSGGTLQGASAGAVNNGATNSLLSASEMVGFQSATLTNPCRYNLGTSIRRGFMNSAISAHAAGTFFVRLDESIFDFPYFAVSVGQTVYVKFQSFNLYGLAAVDLSDCIAYSIQPEPVGPAAPQAGNWAVTGGVVSANGTNIPALFVAGSCENGSASALLLYERTHGTATWNSAGSLGPTDTNFEITGVPSATGCDVGIAYQLPGGVVTAITQIGTNVVTGTAQAGALYNQGALATLNTVTTGQVTGLAPAATDTTIAAGATNNQVYVLPSDPTGSPYFDTVIDGAFWVNSNTGIAYVRKSGAWVALSGTYVSGTELLNAGPGTGMTYPVPSTYPGTTLRIVVTGGDGGNSGNVTTQYGGSADSFSAIVNVTPGSTVISYGGGGAGTNGVGAHAGGGAGGAMSASVSGSFSITAGGGAGATGAGTGAPGAGGTASFSGSGIVSHVDTPGSTGGGTNSGGGFQVFVP